MSHIRCKDQYRNLDQKSDARKKQQVSCGDLLEDQADQGHDRQLQDRLKEVGIAQFFFTATEITDDLDHEIVDHVVGEEKADDTDEKQRKCRVGADESSKRTTRGSAFAFGGDIVSNLVFRFPEGKDQDRGKHHDYDVDVKKDADPVALDESADESGSDGKTCRSQSSGKTVEDRCAGFLVFEAQRRHDRLVGKLDHVDQGEDREDNEFVIGREEKNDRSRKNDQDRDQDETAVGQCPLFVDDAGDDRLHDRREDVGDSQENADFCIGKTVSQKEDRRTCMDRAECGKVCGIDQGIPERPEK